MPDDQTLDFGFAESDSNAHSFLLDLAQRPWLPLTPSQAYGVYVLGLYCNETDFVSLAAEANTDGPDDKKIDLLYIDQDANTAYVGQVCLYESWTRQGADANKASDLAAGIAWLLSADDADLPQRLKPKALELRELVNSEQGCRIELLYIHNAPETANVTSELRTVALSTHQATGPKSQVGYREIGLPGAQRLFDDLDKDVLIGEAVRLPLSEHYEIHGDAWRAIVFALPGTELKRLRDQFEDRLFSANIRGYLSIVNKKGNINRNIRATVQGSPSAFWAFNNGITILTNRYSEAGNELVLEGMSIINGAQTTGVIAEADEGQLADVFVPCRVVECTSGDVVDNIIRFNNTQNAIKSFDLRSNDAAQHRLRESFVSYEIEYVHRRTGLRRLPATAIHADSVAPTLASFHGDFSTAIRNRADIFEIDDKYNRVFPPSLTAEHVYLLQCLADAIDERRQELKAKAAAGSATAPEESLLAILNYSTAKQFVIAVLGRLAEQLVGGRVRDLHAWKAKAAAVTVDRARLRAAWSVAIGQVLPHIELEIRDAAYDSVRSAEAVERVANRVQATLDALRESYAAGFDPLRQATEW